MTKMEKMRKIMSWVLAATFICGARLSRDSRNSKVW